MRFKQTDVSDIGKVVKTPAEFDDEGNVTKQPTFKNGHYVVTSEPVPEWSQWEVTDGTPPPRVFAGREDSSTLYQFPTEQAFINAFELMADGGTE